MAHGKDCDLVEPKTFTEKMVRRLVKLHRRNNPVFTRWADKYMVREEVRARIGDEYLKTLLWHGQDPEGIPFGELPSKYVLKSNHASGHVIIVDGEVDRARIVAQASRWLLTDYYWVARESHYSSIPPRILIEEHLDNAGAQRPTDFMFWCFDGTPAVIQVQDVLPSGKRTNSLFDVTWKQLEPWDDNHVIPPAAPARPRMLDRMIELVSKMATGFDFVRVDLMLAADRIAFGEMTFTPLGARRRFKGTWDLELGEQWRIKRPSGREADADRAAVTRAARARLDGAASPVLSPAKTMLELIRCTAPEDVLLYAGHDEHSVVGGLVRAGRQLMHWGPPSDAQCALTELRQHRERGATVVAFTWTNSWWLEFYSALRDHLRTQDNCLLDNERLTVFRLRSA